MTDLILRAVLLLARLARLALLKNYEQGPGGGFSPVVYRCPAGHKTIGWGHRIGVNYNDIHP